MTDFSNPKSNVFAGKRGGMNFVDAKPRSLLAKLKRRDCNQPKLCPGWKW